MAPKNRPQRGSFNTRGRQKVAAQQAGRRAATPPPSTNVLPPGRPGGTVTRSPRGTVTATTSGGGGRGGRPSLPPGGRGGAPASSPRGKVDPPIERVKVRDLGSTSRGSGRISSGGSRPSLPPGSNGGALATTAKGVGRLGRFLRGAGSVAGAGMTALAAGAEAQKILNPKDNIIHDLRNLGVAIENKVNGKDGRTPYSGESSGAVGGNRRRGITSEKAGPPVPRGLPNRNKPTPPSAPPRPSGSSGSPAPAFRQSAPAPAPRSGGGGSRPSARPSSAPVSAPKAPPAAAKPAPKAPATPAEPNLFNAPRTGVAKFRTDMNPLGKKIVGTTNFSKSVPSERAFDTNSDYSSSLSIPKSEPVDPRKRKK